MHAPTETDDSTGWGYGSSSPLESARQLLFQELISRLAAIDAANLARRRAEKHPNPIWEAMVDRDSAAEALEAVVETLNRAMAPSRALRRLSVALIDFSEKGIGAGPLSRAGLEPTNSHAPSYRVSQGAVLGVIDHFHDAHALKVKDLDARAERALCRAKLLIRANGKGLSVRDLEEARRLANAGAEQIAAGRRAAASRLRFKAALLPIASADFELCLTQALEALY